MRQITLAAAAATLVAASAAQAALVEVASFTFSDLDASYDSEAGNFIARAGTFTGGDVTRQYLGMSSADFGSGSFPASTADVVVNLAVTPIAPNLATGVGSITITDHTGDTLVATVAGSFIEFGGSIAYTGQLSSVFFLNTSGDGVFDGTTAGAFSTAFANLVQPFTGSAVQLFFNPGAFFAQSYDGVSVQASGIIRSELVPAPGTIALGAAGLGLIARRRRA